MLMDISLIEGLAPSVICRVGPAVVLEEISAPLVLLAGGWQQGNVILSVRKVENFNIV